MAKHSFEEKLKIVKAYFNSEGGYIALSKKYQVHHLQKTYLLLKEELFR